MAEISTTGLWVDAETGQVVDHEPTGSEGGRLLVAPGGEITPNVKVDIDMARAAAPPEATATEPDENVKKADENDSDVKTATAPDSDVDTASEDGGKTPAARKRAAHR